jgi:hypothetical protein
MKPGLSAGRWPLLLTLTISSGNLAVSPTEPNTSERENASSGHHSGLTKRSQFAVLVRTERNTSERENKNPAQ